MEVDQYLFLFNDPTTQPVERDRKRRRASVTGNVTRKRDRERWRASVTGSVDARALPEALTSDGGQRAPTSANPRAFRLTR